MSPTTLFFLIVVIAIFVIGVMKVYGDTPDEIIWAVNEEHGLRAVPIYYVDEIENHGEHTKGVYNPVLDEIRILKGVGDFYAVTGCTIRDHEILHAWGYDHVSMQEFNCPNPNVDYDALQYRETFVKHWNPNYEWNGYER